MDAATACALLEEAGIRVAPSDVRVEERYGRWAVWLPGDRMAWFPADEAGRQRLATERRLLRLLEERCSFRVPRVLFEAEAGWEVRALVPGVYDPFGLYERTRTDRVQARRFWRSIGEVLAEQHTRVRHADVAGWLTEVLPWPEPIAWMRERLPGVVDDPGLLAAIEEALTALRGAGGRARRLCAAARRRGLPQQRGGARDGRAGGRVRLRLRRRGPTGTTTSAISCHTVPSPRGSGSWMACSRPTSPRRGCGSTAGGCGCVIPATGSLDRRPWLAS